MGKMLLQTKQKQIDLSAFPQGIYLLRMENRAIKIMKH
jgi:hypothetical protein